MDNPIVKEEFLYAQIADRFESQIQNNILKTGDKLLSVRALSREQGISISTAFKAYIELENKGYIEARAKSGYFVRYNPAKILKPQHTPKTETNFENIGLDEMLKMVYKTMSQEGVVKLSQAVPSEELIPMAKLSKVMMEAIRKSPTSCTGYEEIQGNSTLRKQVAKHAFSWNGNITENEVVTTQGCMEALVFCLKAVTEPGDTVAIDSPTYFGIFNVMKSLGLKVLEIPTDPDTGADLEYLEKAIEKIQVKACLFVTNFANPLGVIMPDNRKKQLVELLAKNQIPLIEDDIYGEMYFGKARPKTCKSFDKEGLVMLCSSVSKTLAPGYRVGWCIPGKFIDKVISLKLTHSVSSASPTQAAIGLFFETGRYDLHMRNMRKALHTSCLRYIQAISEYFPDDTKVSRPQGGYVLWIEMNKKVNGFELFQKAMKENISVSPGQIFSTDARFTNYIRISFGTPYNEEIEKSLQKLGKLVESMI
ncbi:PLP-dependent aminotransferase family protein [Dyadobacter sp. CY356]|uniref:aminotransferase-like domain-containing protein n=1 Tax=Dyadobacter sp. CY356 TaxID=2906442 RepID=UPI001F24C1A0|nr:PLP-dependent aminotransferase family protein [Dyadobacter sp. CY356]MCF0055669.1 PLP-dependent aminotransferase family protein [Dyadobacter sp. CY356]